MGFTLSSIHVYTDQSIESGLCKFDSFSDHWQTCVTAFSNPGVYLEKAKKLSKEISAPVLCFGVFDSDFITLTFYVNGRIEASYSGNGFSAARNIYRIPQLVGYESGEKRRLSRILACADAERQIDMLEELFGVCLLIDEELIAFGEHLHRTKGNALYQAFWEEEKALEGAHANLKANLIFEQAAFLDDHIPLSTFYYPLHYFRMEELTRAVSIVHFQNGKLIPVPPAQQEHVISQRILYEDRYGYDLVVSEPNISQGWRFCENAPEAFAGKVMKLPAGFYPFYFYDKDRFLLSNLRNTVAFMDESLKIIKKLHLQGIPYDVADGYILTFYPYGRCKEDVRLRIYQICEGN